MDHAAHRIDDPAGGVGELAQRGEPAREREVAQDHLVAAVFPGGEELGQPFAPPQRGLGMPDPRVAPEHLGDEAQLEDMHQLVADGMAEVAVAPGEREGDPALQELRDAEQALRRHEGEHVRLLEVGVRGVDDERHAALHVVCEAALQHAVALLGVSERHATQLVLFRIEVEVHVLTAQHAPIEAAVLDLVLPEVAELGRRRRGEGREEEQRAPDRPPHQRWMLRMRSPWATPASTLRPATTRPKTV